MTYPTIRLCQYRPAEPSFGANKAYWLATVGGKRFDALLTKPLTLRFSLRPPRTGDDPDAVPGTGDIVFLTESYAGMREERMHREMVAVCAAASHRLVTLSPAYRINVGNWADGIYTPLHGEHHG